MGLFDFFKGKKKGEKTQTVSFTSPNSEGDKGLASDTLIEIRDHILAIVSTDDESTAFNAASGLMLKGQYQAAVETYGRLAEKFPNEKGTCESQIGAGKFFLGQYEEAIAHYLKAIDFGMEKDLMDDNIWEVCETLYKKQRNKAHIQRYLEWMPDGDYAKKARKLLSK